MIVTRVMSGGENYIAPSNHLNIAAAGAGGKGRYGIENVAHENIYAIRLADTPNQEFAAPCKEKVKTYPDYREMLKSNPEIDAVLISTPKPVHAPIAMYAINPGQHLYLQKPLCHTVAECCIPADAAEADTVETTGPPKHCRARQESIKNGLMPLKVAAGKSHPRKSHQGSTTQAG